MTRCQGLNPPMPWLCWQCAACVPIARRPQRAGEGRPIGSSASAYRDHAKRDGSVAVRRQRSIVPPLIAGLKDGRIDAVRFVLGKSRTSVLSSPIFKAPAYAVEQLCVKANCPLRDNESVNWKDKTVSHIDRLFRTPPGFPLA